MLNNAAMLNCLFCEGKGHHVKDCSSLKNINNAVKNMPAVKILWGNVKHKFSMLKKRKQIAAASLATMELDVPNVGSKRAKTARE